MPKWRLIGDSIIIVKGVGIVALFALFMLFMGARELYTHISTLKH